MHRDDVYPCMNAGCHATPFHLECLEEHYQKCRPLPPQEAEENLPDEEDMLAKESVEAHSQLVDRMINISKISMPRGSKLASIAVALVSMGFAVGPFWSADAPDTHVSFLQ